MSRDNTIIQGRWVYNSGPELTTTLCEHSSEYLLQVTRRILSRADDALFARAQHTVVAQRGEHLEAMRQLRQLRLPLERGVVRFVEDRFGKLRGRVELTVQDSSLSLLDDEPCDLRRSVNNVVQAVLGVHAPALDAIERRFALLRGVRELAPVDNPLSAQNLGEALRSALSEVSLPRSVRELLFAQYEEELVATLAPLLSELNARMMGANILPELGNPRPIEIDSDDGPDAPAVDAPARAAAPLVEVDDEQFNALCEMLHAFRPQGQEEPVTPATHTFATDQMVAVLSLLQPELPATVEASLASGKSSLAGLLKAQLLAAANRIGLEREGLRIEPEAEASVELVGMLFDVMFDERDFENSARSLLVRMVVPFAKAALVDHGLFQSKQHPARRLLNAVAEACEGNRGDGPQERVLLQQVEQTVARLVGDFNEDLSIFETLEHELRAHLDQYRQRIELAERRAADAQRGQERLLQAREYAQRELAQRRGLQALPAPVDEFLDRYWTHHLSMIALREGVHTPAWQLAVGVAERLLALLPDEQIEPQQVVAALAPLRLPITEILASSGVTGDAADDLQSRIVDSIQALARGRRPRMPAPNLQVASVQAGRLPEAAPSSVVARSPHPVPEPDVAASTADIAYVRNIGIGSWVTVPDEHGQPQAVKLSWISPITQRLMFVNRRGVRVLVASVEELAQWRSQGRLELRDSEHVFEQAMDRVIDRLQSN